MSKEGTIIDMLAAARRLLKKGRDSKMMDFPAFMKKAFLAAAVAAMIPAGPACPVAEAAKAAAVESKASNYSADEFIGFWEEDSNGRVGLTITPAEKGWYGIEVSWPRNARQVDMWTMTARPTGSNTLEYADCQHYLLTYGPQYLEKEELLYQNGTGKLFMVGEKRIAWQDDQDHKADEAAFVPLKSPLGGGQ